MLATWSVYEIRRIFRRHLISMARILLCSSAVMDSHMASARISLIFGYKDNAASTLVSVLSVQFPSGDDNTKIIIYFLKLISGLDLSSATTESR